MRKVLVAVLVVLVAVGLAWWAVGRGHETPSGDGGPTTEAGTESQSAQRERERRKAGLPVPDDAPEPSTQPVEDEPRFEVVSKAEAGATLLVVGADGAPAPRVLVRFLAFDPNAPPRGLAFSADQFAFVSEHGRTVRTDDAGTVVLPRFEHAAIVVADTGTERGFQFLYEPHLPSHRLTLSARRELVVRVRRPGGQPVATDVVLLERQEWGDLILARATTDDEGVARVVTSDAALDPAREEGRLTVTTGGPFANPPRAAVPRDALPTSPIDLVVESSGTLRLSLSDPSSASSGAAFSVDVRIADASAEEPNEDVLAADAIRSLVAAGGGPVDVSVGVGLEFDVDVADPEGARITTTTRVTGPTRDGEVVDVALVAGGRRPTVSARLMGPDGKPVAGYALLGELLDKGEADWDGGARVPLLTAADGTFRMPVDLPPGPTDGRKLRLGHALLDREYARAEEFATLDLPAELAEGVNDLGDVPFSGAEVLVTGIVRLPNGEPAAGAFVRAMDVSGGSRFPLDELGGARTGADGRFTLRGATDGESLHLGADYEGHFLLPPPKVRPGDRDVQLQLARAGGLAGSVRIPAGLRDYAVRLLIRGPAQDNNDTDHRFGSDGISVYPDENGEFAFHRLRPVPVSVAIALGHSEDDIVLEVSGLVITAGETLRDPRLQAIDLAALLRSYTVRVQDASGSPIAGATVHHRAPGSDASWGETEVDADGIAHVRARTDAVDLVVTKAGYRAVERKNVSADATFTLVPVPVTRVTVRLADGMELPAPPHQLTASLLWVGDLQSTSTAGWIWDPRTPSDLSFDDTIGKSRRIVLEVWEPGRYRVELTLWKIDMSGGGGGGIGTVPKDAIVTIRGDGAPVTIEVGYDREEYERQRKEDEE